MKLNIPNTIPKYDELYLPTIKALKELSGSGSNQEIYEKVIEIENFGEEEISHIHQIKVDGGYKDDIRTEIEYRLAWAKTYLSQSGYLENTKRSTWVLTELGWKTNEIDENKRKEINKIVKSKKINPEKQKPELDDAYSELLNDEIQIDRWINDLLDELKNISPKGFEDLCALILRENGFEDVDTTSYVNDKGIDGYGILRINLISFKVGFQCKRYEGSVGSPDIRNFRGSLKSSDDRGLFITTGRFTDDAKEEAKASSKNPIDLIDGIGLCKLMKKLDLGLTINEKITIKTEFFNKYK